MKAFYQLWVARNKEFFRDKGSMSWAFIFPVLIIFGCAIAFSGGEDKLLTIGVMEQAQESLDIPAGLEQPYSKIIVYQDINTAKQRLRQHQLHALIDPKNNTLWLNPESTESKLVRQLMINQETSFQVQALSGKAIRYVDWVIPGVLGMNIMFASLFGVGYVLVRYRKNGVLKRLQATPVSAFRFLSAQIASRLFIVVSANAIIFLGSDLFLDLMIIGSLWDLLIVTIFGALSMIALGLLIACRTDSEELAGGILNIATWPMMFLSGIWFSLDDTPQHMQTMANLLPLTHLVEASRDIMINGATLLDVADHIGILFVMCLVCLSLAALLFRWHK